MSGEEARLRALLEQSERRRTEAQETLDAIRRGEVDAVVVSGPRGQVVYTLENADRPYRVLVEQMKEGAVTLNGDGLVLYANRSFCGLVGARPEAVLGASFLRYVTDPGAVESMLAAGVPGSAEVGLRTPDGEAPVKLSIVELAAEEGPHRLLCGVVTDLGENYARAREALQAHERLAATMAELEASEARLRSAFETSYQFQGMMSPDGVLLDANPVSLAAIGGELTDVVGKPYWRTPWFDGTPGMAETVHAAVDAVIAGGTARSEILLNLPRGGWRTFDFSLRGIRGDDGALTAIIPEAVELTDTKRAEEALRQAQKLEAIGQLTGGVAHDFNNLLTVIRGSVELLQRPSLSEHKRRQYTEAIGESADRAVRLTSQLLAFARRQTLKPELFDVATSLESVRAIVASLTGPRIDLDIRLPDERAWILADRSQFDTAIVNMAINARDAMNGEGQIVIAMRGVSACPALRLHPPVVRDFIAVSVIDTGVGIAPGDLDRIFEPFFTTKNVGSGTGLGLSQVIGFAKQSDGEVRVESETGRGARFTLYLPRAEPPAEAPAMRADGEASNAGDGVCVLVVEDNAEVGAFASQALRELGYDSVLAPSAQAALAALKADAARFHVVFSDVIMPGVSGLDLAETVRRDYRDIPVVLASGYSHVLAQGGAHDFELIHKPYSIEELSRVIRRALAGRAVAGVAG